MNLISISASVDDRFEFFKFQPEHARIKPLRLSRISHPNDEKNYFYASYLQLIGDIVIPKALLEIADQNTDEVNIIIIFKLHQKKLDTNSNEYEQNQTTKYKFFASKPLKEGNKRVFIFRGTETQDTLIFFVIDQVSCNNFLTYFLRAWLMCYLHLDMLMKEELSICCIEFWEMVSYIGF